MTTDLQTIPPLVSAAWLAGRLDDPAVRPVDVRWYLTRLFKDMRNANV